MKPELDQELCARYPKIFANRNADMQTTAMCWGFGCGDGWYNIIDQLCANIQNHIDWREKQHAWDLKWNADHPDDLRPVRDPVPQVIAQQVKEKFGGLRFYYEGGDDRISGMESMAESMSEVTCETCGAPGRTRGRGWVYTACDAHVNEQDLTCE